MGKASQSQNFLHLISVFLGALSCRSTSLEMEDCRQLVRSRLQARGDKPFEFVRAAPCYNSSQSGPSCSSSGCTRNPQTESFLQLLELPYLLDNISEAKDLGYSPASLVQRGSFDEYSEAIPIDDVDELEEPTELDDKET